MLMIGIGKYFRAYREANILSDKLTWQVWNAPDEKPDETHFGFLHVCYGTLEAHKFLVDAVRRGDNEMARALADALEYIG